MTGNAPEVHDRERGEFSAGPPRGAATREAAERGGPTDPAPGRPKANQSPRGAATREAAERGGPTDPVQGRPKPDQPPWGAATREAAERGGPLIRLRGVTKVYGEGPTAFQALKGVDLDIERGEFVAIMGPSGSGKSTAMNTLGCLDTPTTGTYAFNGVPVQSLSRDQRALLRRR